MQLTKANCAVSQAKSGNLYISHPSSKVNIRFYAEVKELKADANFRARIALRQGKDDSVFAVLAKEPMEQLDL